MGYISYGKGAFKMHTLIDLKGSIPTFVHLTHGLVHDSVVMDKVPVEPNAYYLMDKGMLSLMLCTSIFILITHSL